MSAWRPSVSASCVYVHDLRLLTHRQRTWGMRVSGRHSGAESTRANKRSYLLFYRREIQVHRCSRVFCTGPKSDIYQGLPTISTTILSTGTINDVPWVPMPTHHPVILLSSLYCSDIPLILCHRSSENQISLISIWNINNVVRNPVFESRWPMLLPYFILSPFWFIKQICYFEKIVATREIQLSCKVNVAARRKHAHQAKHNQTSLSLHTCYLSRRRVGRSGAPR